MTLKHTKRGAVDGESVRAEVVVKKQSSSEFARAFCAIFHEEIWKRFIAPRIEQSMDKGTTDEEAAAKPTSPSASPARRGE